MTERIPAGIVPGSGPETAIQLTPEQHKEMDGSGHEVEIEQVGQYLDQNGHGDGVWVEHPAPVSGADGQGGTFSYDVSKVVSDPRDQGTRIEGEPTYKKTPSGLEQNNPFVNK